MAPAPWYKQIKRADVKRSPTLVIQTLHSVFMRVYQRNATVPSTVRSSPQ